MKEKCLFADTLKKLAKEHGYTQQELAEKMNVSVQTVKKWYTTTMPDIKKLVQLADILDVDLVFLIGAQEFTKLSEEMDELRNRVAELEKIVRGIRVDADIALSRSGIF